MQIRLMSPSRSEIPKLKAIVPERDTGLGITLRLHTIGSAETRPPQTLTTTVGVAVAVFVFVGPAVRGGVAVGVSAGVAVSVGTGVLDALGVAVAVGRGVGGTTPHP